MNIFQSMNISGTALTAQRFRLDVIGQNIANATTTHTENGEPYRRRSVVFEEKNSPYLFSDYLQTSMERVGGTGVRAIEVMEDDHSAFKMVHDPTHPDANDEGYVLYPNVDMEREMVDLISASRSYEANVTVLNNFKNIAMKALEIGR